MEPIQISNPFPGAAAFRVRETTSTMEEARRLARLGFYPGTAVVADLQTAGRGRLADRRWESPAGENLLATLALGPEAARIPGFTLRVGLALCRSAAIFAIRSGGSLVEPPELKWPNDVLIGGKKLAGVLCEAAPEATYVGFGVNLNQRRFPAELEGKATSVSLAMGSDTPVLDRFAFLELVLGQIHFVLGEEGWRAEAETRLWRRGDRVDFLVGLPEKKEIAEGYLEGIAPSGALLIRVSGEIAPRAFQAGELLFPEPRVDRNGSHHIR